MANLEKRIADLEAKAASTDHCVKIFFCNKGDDAEQARINAGIAPDYPGKTVCVQFVASPFQEKTNGND